MAAVLKMAAIFKVKIGCRLNVHAEVPLNVAGLMATLNYVSLC